MKLNTFLTTATLAVGLSAAGVPAALAHGGAQAKHGGILQAASDLTFELVSVAEGAAIYVEDHGKPMTPAGMSGKLTVLTGSQRSEAELAAAGDRLLAKGVTLASGAKVVATLSTADKKAITVRFTVK